MRFRWAALAAVVLVVAPAITQAGTVEPSAVRYYEVEPGDGWYVAATKVAAPCPLTAGQRSTLANTLAVRNGEIGVGSKNIHPGRLLVYLATDVPACAPPTTTTTSSTTVPGPPGVRPTLAEVGPREVLTDTAGGRIACKSYSRVRFTAPIQFIAGCTYTFVDVEACFGVTYPGVAVTVSYSRVTCGWWFEDNAQGGGHQAVRIDHTIIDGGTRQAMRPKGAGTLHIADSWLFTAGTELTGDVHTESVQLLGGANLIADRVVFSVEPRWRPDGGTPITAVLNAGAAGNGSVLTDVEFGYWDGVRMVAGGGFYQVYPGALSFVRPVFHVGVAQAWYSTPRSLVDPIYGG